MSERSRVVEKERREKKVRREEGTRGEVRRERGKESPWVCKLIRLHALRAALCARTARPRGPERSARARRGDPSPRRGRLEPPVVSVSSLY